MSTRLHSHICYFVLSDTGRVMVVYSNRHNIIDKLIASFHWYRFSFDRIASSASLSIILFYQWFSLGRFSLFLSFFLSFTFFVFVLLYICSTCAFTVSQVFIQDLSGPSECIPYFAPHSFTCHYFSV